MDKDTVEALKRLHEQLQHVGSLSESDRQSVEQLQRDIQFLLTSTRKAGISEARPVHAGLQDAIQRFEVTHPELTEAMARVIKQLTDLGI